MLQTAKNAPHYCPTVVFTQSRDTFATVLNKVLQRPCWRILNRENDVIGKLLCINKSNDVLVGRQLAETLYFVTNTINCALVRCIYNLCYDQFMLVNLLLERQTVEFLWLLRAQQTQIHLCLRNACIRTDPKTVFWLHQDQSVANLGCSLKRAPLNTFCR